ncbi:MAG TPA: diacylglycerol kinase family protein [Stellaceae bacterium]|nr:diacylglycerol kinase family protein [Stellaceae bacterium]
MRRILAIYNPTAGRRARGKFERFRAGLVRLGATVTVAETNAPLHAKSLAETADPTRFDAVAVAGGDGTINEAVNGIVHSGLPLAILPLGTANVLAQELGLPRDPEALAEIAALSPTRSIVPAEIVTAERNEPWRFLLMAGIGFDAEVVANLNLKLKRKIGKGAYALGSLAQLGRHERRLFDARIDGTAESPASLVVARGHYYGGKFVLAPQARLDEPALHTVLFPGASRLAALRYMTAVVTSTLKHQCDVEVRGAREIELAGPEGAPVQIDGDVRAHLPASIRLASSPLALIA